MLGYVHTVSPFLFLLFPLIFFSDPFLVLSPAKYWMYHLTSTNEKKKSAEILKSNDKSKLIIWGYNLSKCLVYRRIGILGRHVPNFDRARRYGDRFGTDRNWRPDGSLEKTRGDTHKTKTSSTIQHRDLYKQSRRRGWKS